VLQFDALLAALAHHFEGGLGVGDDIQVNGIGLPRDVDVVAGRPQFLSLGRDRLLLAVAVVVRKHRHMRAQQPLDQVVAGDRGLVDLPFRPQDQIQRDTQLGAGPGQLAAVVGLHGRAEDDCIGAALHRHRQAVLEHSGLIAAESQPGQVVPFDIDLRPAQGRAETRQMLQRRIHLAQVNAIQIGYRHLQFAFQCGPHDHVSF